MLLPDCIRPSVTSSAPLTLPVGPSVYHLRQRKRRLASHLKIPPDALPGSLALSHRRCGKPSCHCEKVRTLFRHLSTVNRPLLLGFDVSLVQGSSRVLAYGVN